MRRTLVSAVGIGGLLLAASAPAQQSPNFSIEENVFNGGGHPQDGVVLASPSFQITLHSIGQGVAAPVLAGASFTMQGGFAASLLPPGEVMNLRFTGPADLAWDVEPSVGDYALYRGVITDPFDPEYGTCVSSGLATESTSDNTTPGFGAALFYLVTARNRLREEGTKGADSDLVERANPAPCP